MNEVWNLDPIYRGFEDPAFAADLQALKETVEAMTAFTADLDAQEPARGLRRGIELEETINDLVNKLAGYASLRQSADTRNPDAGSMMGRIMGVYSGVAAPVAAFEGWAAKLPNLMELVEKDEILSQYTYLFRCMQDSSRYLLPGVGEAVAAKLELSGGSAWAEMHQYLTSTVPVTYEGRTTNLSSIRNLAYDPDEKVRKAAFEAELACYDLIQDPVAYALKSLKL